MPDPLLIDLPAGIDTMRLHLRPPRAGDGAMLHAAVVETLPELRRFLAFVPWVAQEQSPEASEIYCRNSQAKLLARTDLPFLVLERESGRLLGGTGLHRPDWTVPRFEVGYWMRSSAAGKGYATEAVDALVELAFATLSAARVELKTDADNVRSRRVAERCQFQLEGILRHDLRDPDGSLRNTCVYARLR